MIFVTVGITSFLFASSILSSCESLKKVTYTEEWTCGFSGAHLVTIDIHAYQVSSAFYTLILSHFSRLWAIAIPCEEIHMVPSLSALFLVRKKRPLKTVRDNFASGQNHIQSGVALSPASSPVATLLFHLLAGGAIVIPFFPSSLNSSPSILAVCRKKWDFSSRRLLKLKRIWLNLAVKNSCPLFIPLEKITLWPSKRKLITVKWNLSQWFFLKAWNSIMGCCFTHLGLALGRGMHQPLVDNRTYLERKY